MGSSATLLMRRQVAPLLEKSEAEVKARDGEAFHPIKGPDGSWRYPPEEGRRVARALLAAGADAAFIEIDSDKGHEAHLDEDAQFEAALTGFVDAAATARGLSLQTGTV